jgi:FkbM family methyltransferase
MSKKYYGQFDPAVDKVIHERYFPNKYNGVSIECGAFDGLLECNTKFFEDNYNWKTINIEPLPHVFNNLILNRPNSINLNIALSNNDNTKQLVNYIHPTLKNYWGNGSITHTHDHKKHLEEVCGTNNYETHTVQCNTYKQIIETLKLEKLDLFVLDVEGHEPDVLDGMAGCDILPDVFVIEHGHRTPEFYVDKLRILDKSYKLDYISFVNSFYIRNI